MQTNAKKTATFIRKARKQFNFTQAEFARLVGCLRPEISRYESGFTQCGGALILRIMEIMKRGGGADAHDC